jgi:hypothetical protein
MVDEAGTDGCFGGRGLGVAGPQRRRVCRSGRLVDQGRRHGGASRARVLASQRTRGVVGVVQALGGRFEVKMHAGKSKAGVDRLGRTLTHPALCLQRHGARAGGVFCGADTSISLIIGPLDVLYSTMHIPGRGTETRCLSLVHGQRLCRADESELTRGCWRRRWLRAQSYCYD